jgi:catechol-2,3-dioxygenase
MSPPASADSLALARRLHKGRATARRIDTTHLLHLSLPVRDVHRSQHFHARYFGFRAEDAGAVRAHLARLAADKVSIAGHHEAPSKVAFQCVDPDDYRVEVYWMEARAAPR